MSRRIWTEEVLDEVYQLLRRGHGYGEIAEMYGVTRCAVRGAVNRSWVGKKFRSVRGIARMPGVKFWSLERREKLASLYRREVPNEKIAAELGVTAEALKKALTDFGIGSRSRGGRVAGAKRKGFKHSAASIELMRARAVERNSRPDYIARRRASQSSEVMRAKSIKGNNTRRGFAVPDALAAEYRRLVDRKKLTAREAASVLGIEVRP